MKFSHRLHSQMQKRHPTVLFHGDGSRREVALTFDDGPHPRDTPRVLDVLAKHKVHATFFLVGQSVEQYPDLVRLIHQSGHQLALHCYHHVPFPLESASILQGQLDRARNAIAQACSISPETIYNVRPPYGLFNANVQSMLGKWGYKLVMWSSIPPHWMQPIGWTIKQTLNEVFPGSVIVLHDGHGHGKKVSQIVDIIIPQLKVMDFEFVTIEQMQNSITGETK